MQKIRIIVKILEIAHDGGSVAKYESVIVESEVLGAYLKHKSNYVVPSIVGGIL